MADRIAVMREGRFDQIDTPDTLFHLPSTPFVATMAGAGDFLSAEIRGDRAVTVIGDLPWTAANGPSPAGDRAMLLVRADDFDLAPDPEGGSEVVSREFRGDGIVLTVRLSSGATIRCRQHHFSTLTPGTRVSLTRSRSEPLIAFAQADMEAHGPR